MAMSSDTMDLVVKIGHFVIWTLFKLINKKSIYFARDDVFLIKQINHLCRVGLSVSSR